MVKAIFYSTIIGNLFCFQLSTVIGQDEILDSYPALKERVATNLEQVKQKRGQAVVYGRVVLQGDEDPIYIKSQMRILPDGYFCDTVKDLKRPIGFRMHQYRPLDLSLDGKEGDLINLGVVRLNRLPPEEQVALKGKIYTQVESDLSTVTVSLHVGNGPVNTPSNGTEPRPKWPTPIKIDVQSDGTVSSRKFSPIRYYCSIEAPGYVKFADYISFEEEHGYDLGEVILEKEKSFSLEYITSVTGEFKADSTPESVRLKAGDRWKATSDIYGFDLEIKQKDGQVVFNSRYAPCTMSEIGTGPLVDYLDAELPRPQQAVRNIKVENEHVYLIHQKFWKRFILLKLNLD